MKALVILSAFTIFHLIGSLTAPDRPDPESDQR